MNTGAFFVGMPSEQNTHEDQRIVAVGLLTRQEVTLLGAQLSRLYPLQSDHSFSDLLDAIDQADRDCRRSENSGSLRDGADFNR